MIRKDCAGRVCLILAVCLLLSISLPGCSSPPVGKVVEHKDLILVLPGDFIELSGTVGTDFLYGRHSLVLKGLSEKKSMLKAMSLAEYTDYVIKTNKKNTMPQACGAGYMFTYEAPVGEDIYAYTVATYEGQENFWILQFYCPKDTLSENQPEIDIILSGIQPK